MVNIVIKGPPHWLPIATMPSFRSSPSSLIRIPRSSEVGLYQESTHTSGGFYMCIKPHKPPPNYRTQTIYSVCSRLMCWTMGLGGHSPSHADVITGRREKTACGAKGHLLPCTYIWAKSVRKVMVRIVWLRCGVALPERNDRTNVGRWL